MTYYNTNDMNGEPLRKARGQTVRQEDAVLEYFRKHPDLLLTPEDIQRRVLSPAPLTSARRAITNLTKEGALLKTTAQRKGKYGKPVYCWRLKAEHQPQQHSLL